MLTTYITSALQDSHTWSAKRLFVDISLQINIMIMPQIHRLSLMRKTRAQWTILRNSFDICTLFAKMVRRVS